MNGSNWLRKRTLVYNPPIKTHSVKRKASGKVWHIVLRALKRTSTTIGALVLISAFFSIISTTLFLRAPQLPEEMVLFWPVEGGLPEIRSEPGFGQHFNLKSGPTLYQIIRAMDAARSDDRVKALVVSFRSGGLSLAHIEELRGAVARFRESGKPAIFYAADMSSGLGAYFLASAFDEIWMQPVGTLMLAGINMEEPYVKGLLEKLGISATFFRRKEYKTVYESVTSSQMSPPHREMLTSLIGNLSGNIVDAISATRNIPAETIRELVDKGVLTDSEALESGLIDRLDYGDVLVSELNQRITGSSENEDLDLVLIDSYESAIRRKRQAGSGNILFRKNKTADTVALVYVSGVIMPDDTRASISSPLLLEGGIASALTISAAIRDASDDPDIRAIVVRIDSPGGSPSASESIRRAMMRAKEKGKPVYVSMGPMAASGGYWVAASGDRIFALPSTLTGSIGVVSGKLIFSGLWDKLDVNWENVQWGENADLWSFNKDFSAEEAIRMNRMVDSIYDSFVKVVAQGRGMSPEEVEKVARGYVWSGKGAVEAGLVDELGDLRSALDFTAKTLGLASSDELRIRIMPKPKTPAEILLELLTGQVRAGRAIEAQAQMIEAFAGPFMKDLAAANDPGLKVYSPLTAP